MQTELSAGIIVYRKLEGGQQFLVLQSDAGYFDFPKGHLQRGESLKDAAIRETQEETGLTVDVHEGFQEKLSYFFRNPDLVFKIVYFFLGKATNETVVISHEHTAFAWLSPEEAMSTLSFSNSRRALERAMEFLEKHGEK